MERQTAIDTLISAASSWAENLEEMFPRRLEATDSDADLMAVAGADDFDEAKMVRDVWLAVKTLKAGGSHGNVFDYFKAKLGSAPSDATLQKLAVDSNCGQDCQRIIDAAVPVIEAANMAEPEIANTIIAQIDSAVRIFWRG